MAHDVFKTLVDRPRLRSAPQRGLQRELQERLGVFRRLRSVELADLTLQGLTHCVKSTYVTLDDVSFAASLGSTSRQQATHIAAILEEIGAVQRRATEQFIRSVEDDPATHPWLVRERASMGAWTTLCNVWSKFDDAASARACGWIAFAVQGVTDEQLFFRRRDGKISPTGPLLVNAFSKYPGNELCRAGLADIGRRMSVRQMLDPGFLKRFEPRSLTNLVNGLSKQVDPEERDARLRVLGDFLLAKGPRFLESFNPEQLAIFVNGLSKQDDVLVRDQQLHMLGGHLGAKGPQFLDRVDPTSLSNFINGLSKQVDAAHRDPQLHMLGAVLQAKGGAFLEGFNPTHLSTVVNGLGKQSVAARRDPPLQMVGEHVRAKQAHDATYLERFDAQGLSSLVNSLSKVDDAASRHAFLRMIGEHMRAQQATGPRFLEAFESQHLSNIVVGLSKQDDASVRDPQLQMLGDFLLAKGDPMLDRFDAVGLSNLFIGLGAQVDAAARVQQLQRLGHYVQTRERRENFLASFDASALTGVIDGLGKLDGPTGRDALLRMLGDHLEEAQARDPHFLDGFELKHLATLANALSKVDDAAAHASYLRMLGDQLVAREPQLLDGLEPKHVSKFVDGLGKQVDAAARHSHLRILGAHVQAKGRALLEDLEPLAVANITGGLSKQADATVRDPQLRMLGAHLQEKQAQDPAFLDAFGPIDLSVLITGFSHPDDAAVRDPSLTMLGRYVHARHAADPRFLDTFDQRGLASVFSGLTRTRQITDAVVMLAEHFGRVGFDGFTSVGLGRVANGLQRMVQAAEDKEDEPARTLASDRLHDLAGHLDVHGQLWAEAGSQSIGLLLKAMAVTRAHDDLKLIAGPAMLRLNAELVRDGMRSDGLETMGTLCVGLLPLIRSRPLKKHSLAALELLDRMQPVVARKIDRFLMTDGEVPAAATGPGDENATTRSPALSIYQVLKTYAVVQTRWAVRNVPGRPAAVRARRAELKAWLRETLHKTLETVKADLEAMSWSLIAQLDADNPTEALDGFMLNNIEAVTTQHPPAQFDVHAVFDAMRHPPRPPSGRTGLMKLHRVDLCGRALPADPQVPEVERFAPLAQLTGGKLPLVEVELPTDALSLFMLARTITCNIDGVGEAVPFRADLFGGSRMKEERPRIEQLFGGAVKPPTKPGRLVAVALSDTQRGSSFEQLLRQTLTYKESFFYFQRLFLPSAPGLPGLGPHDHVLQGRWSLGLLPDCAPGAHPFKIGRPDRAIALQPHDGCGFIKASQAMLMPACAKVHAASRLRLAGKAPNGDDGIDVEDGLGLAYAERHLSNLPAQALQHYARDDSVQAETRELLKREIETEVEERGALQGEALFRAVTTGRIRGKTAVALPSSDGRIHIPPTKSVQYDAQGGGLLVSKGPYDKPNIRPFATERIATVAKDGDATAQFLEECTAIQYSWLGRDDATGHMFGAKGLLVVVPDDQWPESYADQALVMSTEDVKIHATWTDGKHRDALPPTMDAVATLTAVEIFAPGSATAMPMEEQKALSGDFDGDALLLVSGRPALYEHIAAVDARAQLKPHVEFKPPKTHTPAINADDMYEFGRADRIVSTRLGVLEKFSTLQLEFLAQADPVRERIAERALFGTFEGIDPRLRREIDDLLDHEQPDARQFEAAVALARADLASARHPLAREAAAALLVQLQAWASEQRVGAAAEPVVASSPALSEPFAERFEMAAAAWAQAGSPRERVLAVLKHYPSARLPAREFPQRLGYVDDPVETVLNLLSVGIKVGTDAYKSDTATATFARVGAQLQRAMVSQRDRVTVVPYTKRTARWLAADRFDPEMAAGRLRSNPTLAAGTMEAAMEVLLEQGVLAPTKPIPIRVEVVRAAQQAAGQIIERARRARPAVAAMMERVARRCEGHLRGLEHQVKSVGSIQDKLVRHVERRGRSLEQAVATLGDSLRYAVELPHDRYVERYREAVIALEAEGARRIKVHNGWKVEPSVMPVVNTVFERADGPRFEVQFHTRDSYALKVASHDQYKQSQDAELRGERRKVQRELLAGPREASITVPKPLGVETIADWSHETRAPAAPRAAAVARAAAAAVAGAGEASTPEGKLADRMRSVAEQTHARHGASLRAIVETADGAWDETRCIKSRASLVEKMKLLEVRAGTAQEPAKLNAARLAAHLGDALRYVAVFEPDKLVAGHALATRSLQAAGWTAKRVKNYFVQADTAYLGINEVWGNDLAQSFEIQYHTRETLELKLKYHLAYKQMQLAERKGRAPPASVIDRRARAHARCAVAAKPAGVESIENR